MSGGGGNAQQQAWKPAQPNTTGVQKQEWQAARARASVAPDQTAAPQCKLEPEIYVTWEPDFGRVRKGKPPAAHDLVIHSVGTMTLSSIQVSLSGEQFEIVPPGSYEKSLPPGKTTALKIRFKAAQFGEKTGQITITSNATKNPNIKLAAKGRTYAAIKVVLELAETGEKIPGANLILQQAGQAQVPKDSGALGEAVFETEKDGPFEVKAATYGLLLEVQSLTDTDIDI